MNQIDIKSYMRDVGRRARAAAAAMARADTRAKNAALRAVAGEITKQQAAILKANAGDLRAGGSLDEALKDRLELNARRVQAMVDGLN